MEGEEKHIVVSCYENVRKLCYAADTARRDATRRSHVSEADLLQTSGKESGQTEEVSGDVQKNERSSLLFSARWAARSSTGE